MSAVLSLPQVEVNSGGNVYFCFCDGAGASQHEARTPEQQRSTEHSPVRHGGSKNPGSTAGAAQDSADDGDGDSLPSPVLAAIRRRAASDDGAQLHQQQPSSRPPLQRQHSGTAQPAAERQDSGGSQTSAQRQHSGPHSERQHSGASQTASEQQIGSHTLLQGRPQPLQRQHSGASQAALTERQHSGPLQGGTQKPPERLLVVKFLPARLDAQSEQFASELARHLGVPSPACRILRKQVSLMQMVQLLLWCSRALSASC